MIIARSPLRISFFGGGTDFPKFYKTNTLGGAVINAAIDKYNYINIRQLDNYFKHKYRIRYFVNEEINKIKDIKHPIIRLIFKKYLNNKNGYEIVHNSDLPARSGLGSSSSFTNALILASLSYQNLKIDNNELWKKHYINTIKNKFKITEKSVHIFQNVYTYKIIDNTRNDLGENNILKTLLNPEYLKKNNN